MIKTLLPILRAFVLFAAVAFAALIGYTAYANHAAQQAATAFCDTIRAGADIDLVVAGAPHGSGHRLIRNGDDYLFTFQGGIFHADVCRVAVSEGKVTSIRVEEAGD